MKKLQDSCGRFLGKPPVWFVINKDTESSIQPYI